MLCVYIVTKYITWWLLIKMNSIQRTLFLLSSSAVSRFHRRPESLGSFGVGPPPAGGSRWSLRRPLTTSSPSQRRAIHFYWNGVQCSVGCLRQSDSDSDLDSVSSPVSRHLALATGFSHPSAFSRCCFSWAGPFAFFLSVYFFFFCISYFKSFLWCIIRLPAVDSVDGTKCSAIHFNGRRRPPVISTNHGHDHDHFSTPPTSITWESISQTWFSISNDAGPLHRRI